MPYESWRLQKTLNTLGNANNSLSVLFDSRRSLLRSCLRQSISLWSVVSFNSLAPARLALRANLRLLYLEGPSLFDCG